MKTDSSAVKNIIIQGDGKALSSFIRSLLHEDLIQVFPDMLKALTEHPTASCAEVLLESMVDLSPQIQDYVFSRWFKNNVAAPKEKESKISFLLDHLPPNPSSRKLVKYITSLCIQHQMAGIIHHPTAVHHQVRDYVGIWQALDHNKDPYNKERLYDTITPDELFVSLQDRVLQMHTLPSFMIIPPVNIKEKSLNEQLEPLVRRDAAFWKAVHEKVTQDDMMTQELSKIWPSYSDIILNKDLLQRLVPDHTPLAPLRKL